MNTVSTDYFYLGFFVVVTLSMFAFGAIIRESRRKYIRKLSAMFLKGQYQDIIKYGQAKIEKEAFSEYFKEGIAMSVIASALMIDDYNLAFAYIDKLTLKKASQIKAVYYMNALILSGDNSKAEEVFSDFSDRKDPISIDVVVKYKPYFDFITLGKPIDETFLQTIKSPIQNKIYTKISGKL